MEKSFVEVKLFQVKPDKLEQFEAMVKEMSDIQMKCEGCLSIKYFKRFFTIDGIELGEPPRELTKIVKCVKYYSYWEFDTKENYGKAIKLFFDNYMKALQKLLISPFDPKSIPEIEKAINIANIGINPVNDGKVIRLQIPQVTEERRKELTKTVKKMGEETKVAVRNLRRDANDKVKKLEKAGDYTEDDRKEALDDIQKMVDQAIKDIDDIVAAKEAEIMEV